jgi:uncharacterized protein (DUF3084 family)
MEADALKKEISEKTTEYQNYKELSEQKLKLLRTQ